MTITTAELDQAADKLLEKSIKEGKDDKKIDADDISADYSKPENQENIEDEKNGGEEQGKGDIKKALNTDSEIKKESLETGDEDDEEKNNGGDEDGKGEGKQVNLFEDDEGGEDDDNDDLEKSFRQDFENNGEINGAMKDSQIMIALVEVLSKSLADMVLDLKGYIDDKLGVIEPLKESDLNESGTSLNKAMFANLKSQEYILAGLNQNTDFIKSVTAGLNDVRDDIGELTELIKSFSHTPNLRKSVQSDEPQIRERNFNKSIGAEPTLTKSEILSKLTAELQKGNPLVTVEDIISVESGAPLKPGLKSLIQQ